MACETTLRGLSIQRLTQAWTISYCKLLGVQLFDLKLSLSRCVIHIPVSLCRVTKPKGIVSSIICLSQPISEVRDVPLSVFIDKSPVLTTKVFYYKENPKITAVLPDCSFDRYISDTSSTHSSSVHALCFILSFVPVTFLIVWVFSVIQLILSRHKMTYFHFNVELTQL